MHGLKLWRGSAPLLEGGLQVNGLGIREAMAPRVVHRPRGTGDYLFMYFPHSVDLELEGQRIRSPSSCLMLWEPPDSHYYGRSDRLWIHSWVHCHGPLVQTLLEANLLPRRQPLPVQDRSAMDRFLKDLHAELTAQPAPDPAIVQNLFDNWMRQLRRSLPPGQTGLPIPVRFGQLKRYLEGHFTEGLTLERLAREFRVSKPHLCSEFQRYFGTSIMEYVIRLRLHRACYHLRDVNLNVTEVAERVGYADPAYFSRLFRQRMGISPRAFRSPRSGDSDPLGAYDILKAGRSRLGSASD